MAWHEERHKMENSCSSNTNAETWMKKLPWLRVIERVRTEREARATKKEQEAHAFSLLAQKWAVYTRPVLLEVAFFPDHKAIQLELIDHLETRCADYQQSGLTPEQAKERTLADMGDAAETGRALHQIHTPWLGWLWLACKYGAILLALMVGFALLDDVVRNIRTYCDPYPASMSGDATLQETLVLDVGVTSYDTYYHFDEVRFYDNGEIELCYKVVPNPFIKRVYWSDTAVMDAYTAEGERLEWLNGGGGENGTGWFRTVQTSIVAEDKETRPALLYVYAGARYGKGVLIDLAKGEVVG